MKQRIVAFAEKSNQGLAEAITMEKHEDEHILPFNVNFHGQEGRYKAIVIYEQDGGAE